MFIHIHLRDYLLRKVTPAATPTECPFQARCCVECSVCMTSLILAPTLRSRGHTNEGLGFGETENCPKFFLVVDHGAGIPTGVRLNPESDVWVEDKPLWRP